MDFKTRFQGKMSQITKDGSIDGVIMSTEKMMPIGKPQGVYQGASSAVGQSEPTTPIDNNNFDVNVGFSY